MNGIIYHVFCTVNGKCYIGQTTQALAGRKSAHLCSSRKGSPSAFHSAIRKHGPSAFVWTVLTAGLKTREELDQAEIYWIKFFESKGRDGYNETSGGSRWIGHNIVGRRWKPEVIKKRAASNRGKKAGPMNPEHRAKISAALKGKKKPPRRPEHTANAATARRGKKDSQKTRLAKSLAQYKRWARIKNLST